VSGDKLIESATLVRAFFFIGRSGAGIRLKSGRSHRLSGAPDGNFALPSKMRHVPIF
jgi:hypothetical protein